ncbi:hypothetical protein [Actinomyces qiguomingii]|uniref:hypothetical protein n=1 Tax=Actinomyces qiguomingii TaxID=2057800 RepID=UPI000FFED7D5|nr:hypothetical protein [Actinomyces qiguomingii]
MRDLVLALPAGLWTPVDDVTILNRGLAEAYRSKTSKTVTRDINGLVKMGLVEKQRGRGVRPRVEVMSAFLPPRRDPSAGQ